MWKDDLLHGKGKEFYSNNIIRYDGDWKENQKEGVGKEFYSNENMLGF